MRFDKLVKEILESVDTTHQVGGEIKIRTK